MIFQRSNECNPQQMGIRPYLTKAIGLCILPVLIVTIGLAAFEIFHQHSDLVSSADRSIRNITKGIDDYFRDNISALEIVAASPLLDDAARNEDFYTQAKASYKIMNSHLALLSPDKKLIFHTRIPFGQTLEDIPTNFGSDDFQKVLTTGKPVIANIFTGHITKKPLVAVGVPVIRDNKIKAVLVSAIETSRLQEFLANFSLPADWDVNIVDGTGSLAAWLTTEHIVVPHSASRHLRLFTAQSSISPYTIILEIPWAAFLKGLPVTAAWIFGAVFVSFIISYYGARSVGLKLMNSMQTLLQEPSSDAIPLKINEINAVRQKLFENHEARAQAEAKLTASEKLYRDLYENAPDMYFTVDATTWTISECNLTMTKLLRYSKDELIHRPLCELHPENIKEAERVRAIFLNDGHVLNQEFSVLTKDGRKLSVLVNAVGDYDNEGKLTSVRVIFRDNTERKKTEEELHRLTQDYAEAQRVAQIGNWSMDLTTDRINWSEETYRIFDISKDEFRADSESFMQMVHPDDHHIIIEENYQRTPSMGADFDYDYRIILRNGKIKHVREVGYAIFNAEGKVERLFGTVQDITDRKLAEEALRQSEERFTKSFQNNPAIHSIIDLETGILIEVNLAWVETFGYSREESVGRTLPDLGIFDEKTYVSIIHEVRKCRSVRNRETEMTHRSGTKKTLLMSREIIILQGKEYMLSMGQDFTEIKRLSESIERQHDLLKSILQGARDAIYAKDTDGRYLIINQAGAQMLGYRVEDVIGKTDFDLLPEPIARDFSMTDHVAFEGKQNVTREENVILRGVPHYFEARKSPWKDHNGNIIGVIGISYDITERKQMEEELRKSEERYRTVADFNYDWEYWIDQDGQFVYISPSCERITGYAAEELSKNIHLLENIVHPEDASLLSEHRMQVETQDDDQSHSFDFRIIHRDGDVKWINHVCRPVYNKDNRSLGRRASNRDVTSRKLLEQQILQAQKMESIGTLAGGIAHDFNNILQVALGYSELLLSEKSPESSEYADLQKIHKAATNGAELVRSILTFSRKLEPKCTPLDLNHYIMQVKNFLSRTISKTIEMRLELSDDLFRVFADPTQIEQVFMNIALNARDAIGSAGVLTFKTENVTLTPEECGRWISMKHGDYAVVTLTDTGLGMTPETLEHIFEPFFTTKELGRGTGLGLAMVYGIIKQHGGHIECESELGKGTTFRIYLPAFVQEPAMSTQATEIYDGRGTETVLIVDDEQLVRNLGKRILESRGYTVFTANDGAEAVQFFRRHRAEIDLVILDLIMPSMDGKTCLLKLLEIDPETRIVVASGYSAEISWPECLELGAKGFIAKPFRFTELLKEVRTILDAAKGKEAVAN